MLTQIEYNIGERGNNRSGLDRQTEILTRTGWTPDVHPGDTVAAYNVKTKKIEFTPVLSAFQRPLAEGECFCSIKGPACDIRVLSGQNILYTNETDTEFRMDTAEKLCALNQKIRIPVAGYNEFDGIPLSDDEIRMCAWIMACGSVNRYNGQITISNHQNTENIAAIESCLKECRIKYGKRNHRNSGRRNKERESVIWTVSKGNPRKKPDGVELTGWEKLEPYLSKSGNVGLEKMTCEQYQILLSTMQQAVGDYHGASPLCNTYQFSKNQKCLVELLQIMGIQRGYRSSITVKSGASCVKDTEMYNFYARKDPFVAFDTANDRFTSLRTEQHTEESCWGVETAHGTVVTRRNGKIAILSDAS